MKKHLQQPTKCKLCFRRFCDHSCEQRGIEFNDMWECSPSCWCKNETPAGWDNVLIDGHLPGYCLGDWLILRVGKIWEISHPEITRGMYGGKTPQEAANFIKRYFK